jgi:DNA-binding NtrC family response regulator
MDDRKTADQPIRVLVVDDDAPVRRLMQVDLSARGFEVKCAASGAEALAALEGEECDVVVLDLYMPGMTGLEVLRRIREGWDPPEVLVATAFADVESAVTTMKLGAYDYLAKPFHLDEAAEVIHKAAEKRRLRQENVLLRSAVTVSDALPELVSTSRGMREVLGLARDAATTEATVLIAGETGTGKELLARLIHRWSARAGAPFVPVNCGAFQDQLLESELFGHERGAFTGAMTRKRGLVEVAGGGTLFLDELGEMSPAMQVRLLRFLQNREVRRVGAERTFTVDARVIAATNRDLAAEVERGAFRRDLYYRVNVLSIRLPALRERPEDIPVLVAHLLQRPAPSGRPVRGVTPEALEALKAYPWPGNVRELENVLQRMMLASKELWLGLQDVPPEVRSSGARSPAHHEAPGPLDMTLEDAARTHIERVLRHVGGKKVAAAKILGIDVKTLRAKLKEG